MTSGPEHMHTCPHCGMPIEEDRYVRRKDGTYRCEHCYFTNTYLDGIVQRMETGYFVTLEAFVNAIDAREHEVGSHSLRVTEFSLIIGNACGIQGRDLVDLYCGSLLHDIGKIGVPDAVLHKAGPLNSEELTIMRKHSGIGYGIVRHIGYFARATEIIHTHHEHYDGSGYPRGLKGEEIPRGARVFAVADALDALTVARAYRQAVSFEGAIEELLPSAGKFFDPVVVEAFLAASDELKDYIGRIVFSRVDISHDDLTGSGR